MTAVYITAAVFFVLLFPLSVRFDVFFDKSAAKMYFSVTLYGKLKIVGGYAEIIKEGIAMHLTDKKAVILPFASLDMRKQFSLTKDYRVYSFYVISELGNNCSAVAPFMFAAAENAIAKTFFAVMNYFKPRLKLENDVLLYEEKNVFKLNAGLTVVFNLLTLMITFIKIIIGKLTNGK